MKTATVWDTVLHTDIERLGAAKSQSFVDVGNKTWANSGASTVSACLLPSELALRHRPGLGDKKLVNLYRPHACCPARHPIQIIETDVSCAAPWTCTCPALQEQLSLTLSNSCLHSFTRCLRDKTSPLLHDTLSDSLIVLRCWGELVLGVRRPVA